MMSDQHLDASLLDKGREEREKREQARAELRQLYAESIKDIHVGKIVEGTILEVGKDFVLVDIGYKSEGAIAIEEFRNRDALKAGESLEMTVEGKEEASRQAGKTIDLSDLKATTETLPFLSVECDGSPFSQIIRARLETFLLQADRLHGAMLERRARK